MNLYEYQRSKPFIDLDQGHSDSTFLNFFSWETAGSIEAKFDVDPPWMGERKGSNDQDGRHAIYGKTWTILLLWNQKADDLESWYAASGTWVLPCLFKWCLWVDHDLFIARSNFVPYAFILEEGKTMGFSEIIVVYDIKVGSWVHEAYEYQRSRPFIDLGPNISDKLFLTSFPQ